jgi:Ca2+-binding EF-hand superfamily protein
MTDKTAVKDDAALRELFCRLDKDNSGYLDHSEVKVGLRELGHEYTDEEVNEIIRSVDENSNGQVEYEGNLFLVLINCFRILLFSNFWHEFLRVCSDYAAAA